MKPVALLISDHCGHSESLRQALASGEGSLRLADTLPLALARLAGGGISSLVVDLDQAGAGTAPAEQLRALRAAAPHIPLYLWSEGGAAAEIAASPGAGVTGCLTTDMPAGELTRLLFGGPAAAAAVAPVRPVVEMRRTGVPATVVAVMGAKGGVGTTTVAMNVAASLALRGRVVLAELRSYFGSLHSYFQPGKMIRGLVASEPWRGLSPGLLWPVPTVPGLRICFGPQRMADCGELSAATAAEALDALSATADYVVLDLPAEFSSANRALLAASHYLALTMTPTTACVAQARTMLEAVEELPARPAAMGLVPVTRTPEGVYLPVGEIESALELPVYRAVPPAPELCAHGERSHTPMMLCDPESLAADSFAALAQSLHSYAPAGRRAGLG